MSVIVLPLLIVLFLRLTCESRIINDLQWVNLNDTEYTSWLNPTDRCMLKDNFGLDRSHDMSLQEYKSAVCRNVSNGERALKCSVGMGVGHIMPCWHPFGGRSFFGKGIQGYTDFNMRYVEKIVDDILKKNATLVFVGDSVMGQAFEAFECQYVREKLVSPWDIFSWKTAIKFVGCSRRACKETDMMIVAAEKSNSTIHIIRNFGLHYNDQATVHFESKETYKRDIVLEFDKLNELSKSPRYSIVWMDTLHQHFPSSLGQHHNPYGNGYYPTERAISDSEAKELQIFYNLTFNISTIHSPGGCCSAIINSDPLSDWRNSMVSALFATGKYDNISRIHLPTFNMSDMHICTVHHRGKTDCTHFCYLSTLWQPLWGLLHTMLSSRD